MPIAIILVLLAVCINRVYKVIIAAYNTNVDTGSAVRQVRQQHKKTGQRRARLGIPKHCA